MEVFSFPITIKEFGAFSMISRGKRVRRLHQITRSQGRIRLSMNCSTFRNRAQNTLAFELKLFIRTLEISRSNPLRSIATNR